MKARLVRIISVVVATAFIPSAAFAGTTATVTVSITVLQGQSSIAVDTTAVAFGSVSGSVSAHRFISSAVKVSYFAANNPWTIRVYTANPGNVPGLIGVTDSTKSIPLKTWCDNYGPRLDPLGHAPDVNNKYFWAGYDFNGNGTKTDLITDGSISEVALGFDVNGNGIATDTGLGTAANPVPEDPIWMRVPDQTEQIVGNPYTWRRLTYSGAELDSTGFPVYFGVDVSGVTPQDYKTTTLTFQIINE